MAVPQQDVFSPIAAQYRRFRPHYPDELFAYLASVVPRHDCAWDCATGNGQAAIGLAEHFERVVASDISASQLAVAFAHPAVHYQLGAAERSGLPPASADLVTVGEALHWFDVRRFGEEAARVLRPGGKVAVWNYRRCQVTPRIDAIVAVLQDEILAGHWAPEALRDDVRLHDLALDDSATPEFSIVVQWPLKQFIGYLGSWSACASYRAQHGSSPVDLIANELARHWSAAGAGMRISWPLNLRVGTPRRA
jgi:SAM-dependent methyltransferase